MACLYADGILLLQTILYFTIFTTGLATAIAMGLTKNDFGGICVLYGKANCSYSLTNANYSCEVETAGRPSLCLYITAINVLVCIFYAFANGCYHAYSFNRSRVLINVGSTMWLRLLIFGTALASLLVLVAACTLTVGLSNWCDSTQHPWLSQSTTALSSTTLSTTTLSSTTLSTTLYPTTGLTSTTASTTVAVTAAETVLSSVVTTVTALSEQLKNDGVTPLLAQLSSTGELTVPTHRCIDTQLKVNFTWSYRDGTVEAGSYFYFLSVAESASWASFTFWLMQLIFYIHRYMKSRKMHRQPTYTDPFSADDAFDVFN